MRIPERQVLPRAVDHALDLASASSKGQPEVFICDFLHAFMTVPAAPSEARFNCCHTDEAMRRGRPPLDDDEPDVGCFIVWCVLGFGGRAYPLLYARVA